MSFFSEILDEMIFLVIFYAFKHRLVLELEEDEAFFFSFIVHFPLDFSLTQDYDNGGCENQYLARVAVESRVSTGPFL